MEMKQKKESKLIIFFILIYLFLNTISFSIKLSSVEGINKLSNYNEIKNKEVKKIVSEEELERKNGLVYEKNKNIIFNGVLIVRNNRREILGIYIYVNGKTEDYGYDYYENGQLEIKVKQKNDKSEGEAIEYYKDGKLKSKRYYSAGILEEIIEYKQNGTVFRTYQAIEGINGIEVLDDYTVKVTTEKPMAALLNNLSNGTIAILSEKATTEAGEGFGQHPIGTGPYKFVSWQSGDKITLEAFPEYWQGPPSIKNVVFKSIVEETNRTIGLETGELDVVYDILGMDKTKLREDERFTFIEEPQLALTYLGFNLKKEPYNNLKVREAISYPDGFKAKLWVNDNPVRRDTAVILQDQLKQIGIDVAIETLEWGAFLDGTARGEHEMFILGWVNTARDPDMYELVSTSTMGAAGNRSFYSDPEMDKMLAAGKVELDPEKRKEIYKEIQIKIRKDIPMYMIAYPLQNVVTQKNIKNFKLDPAQEHTIFGVVKE